MKEFTFRVSLTPAGEPDEDGIRSLRITFKPYIRDHYKLEKGDVLNIIVIGVYKDKNALKYEPLDFKLYGKVSAVGGRGSLGMTVEKDEVRRQNLKEENELEVKITVM